ncbi:MAG: aminopeptidase P family protein, partial [Nitrospirae bacterium]
MGDFYRKRRQSLVKLFKRFRVEAFLVTDIRNVRYLTGFSGSTGFVFLGPQDEVFITDFRYEEQSKKEVQGIDIFIADNYIKAVRQFVRKWKVERIGFEASQPYKLYEALQRFSKPKAIDNLVERLRICKDEAEIAHIKEAILRAERAFLEVKPFIKVGKTEREIALRLEEAVKRQGSTKVPFEFIVASGPNSAMPHARPTERKISPGDLVVIDWGAEANGYFSDMTRTLLFDGPERSKKIEIYNIVKRANVRAIKAVRPDISVSDVDTEAREYI